MTLRFEVDEEIEEMEVLLTLAGGETFPLRVTREMPPGTHEITWRVPNLATTKARLALRVGDQEGESIRDVSNEFTIAAAGEEPLEDVRPFAGEWRAGEALEELPASAPLDPPGLVGAGDSIRALRHEFEIDRTNDAAPAGAPSDGAFRPAETVRTHRIVPPASRRVPLNVPRRE